MPAYASCVLPLLLLLQSPPAPSAAPPPVPAEVAPQPAAVQNQEPAPTDPAQVAPAPVPQVQPDAQAPSQPSQEVSPGVAAVAEPPNGNPLLAGLGGAAASFVVFVGCALLYSVVVTILSAFSSVLPPLWLVNLALLVGFVVGTSVLAGGAAVLVASLLGKRRVPLLWPMVATFGGLIGMAVVGTVGGGLASVLFSVGTGLAYVGVLFLLAGQGGTTAVGAVSLAAAVAAWGLAVVFAVLAAVGLTAVLGVWVTTVGVLMAKTGRGKVEGEGAMSMDIVSVPDPAPPSDAADDAER